MQALIDRQGEVQDQLDAADAWNLDSRLEMAMDALRCPPADTKIGVLSGGEKRRVALCRILLKKPDILLLDEPTNHLDLDACLWLENWLRRYPGTLLFISHDLAVVSQIADDVAVMYRGQVLETAPAETFFNGPAHPYSQLLLAHAGDNPPATPIRLHLERDTTGGGVSRCVFADHCPRRLAVC